MSNYLEVAISAAKLAGETVKKAFNQGVDVRYKGESFDLVTDTDLAAEKIIVEEIKKHFKDHSFLGEEAHADSSNSDNLWVIDPIDGTTNFTHGIPHIGISIAYAEKGEVKSGVVYNPITDELYCAEKGKGALYNSKKIAVSKADDLKQALVGTGFYYDRGQMTEDTLRALQKFLTLHIHGVRRCGAAALDLCYIASGKFDIYFEYKLNPWDFAAGMLIVKEAGGMVSDCYGKKLELKTSGVYASNGLLQDVGLEVLKEFL